MAASNPSITFRLTATGSQQVQGEIRRTAGFLDIVVSKARQSNEALKSSSQGARQLAESSDRARGTIDAVATETQRAERNTRSLAQAAREGGQRFKEMASGARETTGQVHKVWSIYKALQGGGPLSLFNAVAPDGFKRKMGLGMLGAGIAEGAVLGKSVGAAGSVEQIRGGYKTMLGSDAGADAMLEQVKAFDAKSPFDFQGSAKGAQLLLAMGVAAQDVLPTMYSLGDAVSAAGGNQDTFSGAILALGQMQSKGKLSMEEIGQLAERGIPALDILAKKLKWTQEQKADFMAGKLSVSADVGLPALREGFSEKFKGGMDTQSNTFQGKVSTLQGAIFQLEAAIGQHLLPAVTMVVGVVSGAVDAFNALPAPIHQIIAYSMAANAGLLIFAGVLLLIAGPIGTAITLFKVLTFTLPFVNKSIVQLAWSLLSTLMPSLAAIPVTIGVVMASVALLAVIVGAAYLAWKGTEAAVSQSSGELELHFGALGRFWASAADFMTKALNHPLFKAMFPLQHLAAQAMGFGTNQESSEDEQKRLDNANRARRREGRAELTVEQFRKSEETEEETVDEARARKAKATVPAATSAIAQGATVPPIPTPVAPSFAPLAVGAADAQLRSMQSADVQKAQGAVDDLTSEIQSLQDRKRTASKEEKVVIGEQIIEKQRALAAARRELAATKTLSGKAERAAKAEEKAAEKRGDLYEKDARGIDKIKSDNTYNERISDLQDELDKAKEDANSTRVRALTIQVARMAARRELDEALINARDEEDDTHRKGLEAQARAKFDYENGRGALRAGQKAFNQAENGDKGKKRDASIRATLAAMNSAVVLPGMGTSALNPSGSGGAGDRFAGLTPMVFSRNSTPPTSSYLPGGSNAGGEPYRELSQNQRMDSNGDVLTKIEIEVRNPNQGIGAMRGRMRR